MHPHPNPMIGAGVLNNGVYVGSVLTTQAPGNNITFPGGAAAGDLAIVAVTFGGTSAITFSASGWNQLYQMIESGTSQTMRIGWKVLTAGDISSPGTVGGYNDTGTSPFVCAVFRNCTSVSLGSGIADATGTTLTIPGFAKGYLNKFCLSLASDRDTGAIGTEATFTSIGTVGGASIYAIGAAYSKTYVSGANSVWSSMPNGSSRVSGGCLLELT